MTINHVLGSFFGFSGACFTFYNQKVAIQRDTCNCYDRKMGVVKNETSYATQQTGYMRVVA
jgi:hypothetical protein